MAKLPFDQQQKILREIYRHYIDLKDFFSRTGRDTITYGPITISLLDLQYGVSDLSPRKKEAFYLNVICDMKQKDVAAIMGITTVSVGQYVEQACIQLCERYFAHEIEDIETYTKWAAKMETRKDEKREALWSELWGEVDDEASAS